MTYAAARTGIQHYYNTGFRALRTAVPEAAGSVVLTKALQGLATVSASSTLWIGKHVHTVAGFSAHGCVLGSAIYGGITSLVIVTAAEIAKRIFNLCDDLKGNVTAYAIGAAAVFCGTHLLAVAGIATITLSPAALAYLAAAPLAIKYGLQLLNSAGESFDKFVADKKHDKNAPEAA